MFLRILLLALPAYSQRVPDFNLYRFDPDLVPVRITVRTADNVIKAILVVVHSPHCFVEDIMVIEEGTHDYKGNHQDFDDAAEVREDFHYGLDFSSLQNNLFTHEEVASPQLLMELLMVGSAVITADVELPS